MMKKLTPKKVIIWLLMVIFGYHCTCQQKLDTKLKKLGIKIEYLYKIQ